MVCLLNGLAMHTKAWYPFLAELTDGYDVLLYDYLGQGESSPADVPYSIPELAGYLVAILDQLGLERIHLMGVSYGGFVALEFARAEQERLHTLTLSGILLSHERTSRCTRTSRCASTAAARRPSRSTPTTSTRRSSASASLAVAPETFEAMRQRFVDRYVDARHCLVRLTEAQNPFFDALEEPARLPRDRHADPDHRRRAGPRDPALGPAQARRAAAQHALRGGPGRGHVVYLEKPKQFFGMIRAFMESKSLDFECPV